MSRSKNVEISVIMIAKTVVNREVARAWLDRIGAEEYELPVSEDLVGYKDGVTNAALLTSLAAKQCYMSFVPGLNPNVTKVRTDLAEYLDNILASGHGSVLEHSSYSFAIDGVSRVFTGEMNRHRAGWAISERSMRFIRFEDEIRWWMPTSLRESPDDSLELAERKRESRELFHEAFEHQSEAYSALVKIWDMDASDKDFAYRKKVTSCLRRIIGMGVATGGIWTGNVRALRHVLAMRCSPAAEEEICAVFSGVAKMIAEIEPMLFGDFTCGEDGFWRPKYVKV